MILWGTWAEDDQAATMVVTLPVPVRIYQVYLTDSSVAAYSAVDTTMCWDRDQIGTVVSSFIAKATFPPSAFSWLLIGKD